MKRIITLITLVLVSASTLMCMHRVAVRYAKQSVRHSVKPKKRAKKQKMKESMPLLSGHWKKESLYWKQTNWYSREDGVHLFHQQRIL